MDDISPNKVNAFAISQTLNSFAESLNNAKDGSPEATIRQGFRAAAKLIMGSTKPEIPETPSIDDCLAILNLLTAGMDRMLELSAMEKVEIPFGR